MSRESTQLRANAQPISLSLPQLVSSLRDKTIVINGGGGFTIESHQLSQKERLFEQLKVARRLRAVMEKAANEAEASTCLGETRDIILQHKNVIHELVALTQAVRGNYTLDSYNVYSVMYQEKDRAHEKEFRAAKKVLRSHLKKLAKESNPDFVDEEDDSESELDEKLPELNSVPQMLYGCDNEDDSNKNTSNEMSSNDNEMEESTAVTSKYDTEEINESCTDMESEPYVPTPPSPPTPPTPPLPTSKRRKRSKAVKSKVIKTNSSRKAIKNIKGPSIIKKRSLKSGRQISLTTRSSAYEEEKRQAARKKRSLRSKNSSLVKVSSSSTRVPSVGIMANNFSANHSTKHGVSISSELPSTENSYERKENSPSTNKTKSSLTSFSTTSNANRTALKDSTSSSSTVKAKCADASTGTVKASSHATSQNSSKNAKTITQPRLAPRKCHYCKVTSNTYLRCHFFFVNGNKCGKVFCKDCLTHKFDYLEEAYANCIGDKEWHCPSCLQKCDCQICVRNRARTSTYSRRTKTRAAESSYIY